MPETKSPREIHLKSDKGEIDVFLCHDDAQMQQQQHQQLSASGDSLLDDIRPYVTPIVEKYLSPRNNGNGKCIMNRCLLHRAPSKYFIFHAGKPSTYPLRSAQRNLNKILMGTDDLPGSECSTQSNTVVSSQEQTASPKSLFELDSLINNVLNGNESYASIENVTMQSSANPPMAKDMNNMSSNGKSARALKNDVELNEYNGFPSCYSMQTQSHQQQQQQTTELRSSSQLNHLATNDDGHLSKLFTGNDSSMLMNNNNTKSNQSSDQQNNHLPMTPQPCRIRNSLISDITFSPINGIMSQDNASGEFDKKIIKTFSSFIFPFNFIINHRSISNII